MSCADEAVAALQNNNNRIRHSPCWPLRDMYLKMGLADEIYQTIQPVCLPEAPETGPYASEKADQATSRNSSPGSRAS
jgi:hypothetical protein